MLRPLRSLVSICVILSTGSWRDRKWQVAVRLTGQDILVSVFTLVFWLLAFFPGIQQFALLLLKYLTDKRKKEHYKANSKRFIIPDTCGLKHLHNTLRVPAEF